MNLDEPARFGEVDSRDALADLEHVAEQWGEARTLVPGPLDLAGLRAVVVTGMGGSGIAGDLTAVLAADQLPIPVVVHKGYGLPTVAGPGALVVAVSHSGETAETLDAARTALARGAQLVGVGGGGPLAALGEQHVLVPRRTPPRHALPLLVAPVLALLGLAEDLEEAEAAVRSVTAAAARDVPSGENAAKRLARQLADGPATVVGTQGIAAVAAYRLACQLAENAGVSVAHGQLPELAHNLVAAWSKADERSGVVFLRDPGFEPGALVAQVSAVSRLARDCNRWTTELESNGRSALARLAALVALVDLVSVYTAIALDRDPSPIEGIDRIKAESS